MTTVAAIAHALKGQRTRQGWIAHCPVAGHGRGRGDRTRSLSLAEGRGGSVLMKCFAGCDWWEIKEALRSLDLWPQEKTGPKILSRCVAGRPHRTESRDHQQRTVQARAIWHEALPVEGTIAEDYLQSRGITILPPPTLRFCPAITHAPTRCVLPAMVAAVQGPDGAIVAIHRIYLSPDGGGKADIAPVKMSLGPTKGGAIRLCAIGPTLCIAEGIETGLSVFAATGIPTWAALSAVGMKELVLPKLRMAAEVIIAADGDEVGMEAAYVAAARWHHEGRIVRIAVAPQKQDFNDILVKNEPQERSA